MKKFIKSFALVVIEKHDFEGNHMHIDNIVVVDGVINPEESKEKWIYQGTWRGIPVSIPSVKCSPIPYNPEETRKIENWFDGVATEYVNNEPPLKEYSNIIIEMRKRSSYESVWKKIITFKPDGKDKVTSDDILTLKEITSGILKLDT